MSATRERGRGSDTIVGKEATTGTVKISDVAREAGVSPATASRALNNNPNVDPDRLRRVLEAAERLGYRGNSAARNLRRGSSELIALIIPDIEDYFCTAVARGAEHIARQHGYSLMLCNSDGNSETEANYLTVAESQQVAGVLLAATLPLNVSRPAASLSGKLPIIAIDIGLGEGLDSVVTDSYAGGRVAADHLVDQGWSRLACVAGPEESPTSSDRVAGFVDALAARGFAPRIVHTGFDRLSGEAGLAELLDTGEPPDGVFAANERLTTGVLTELRRRDMRLGRDLGLVGFDDAPWAPLVDVPLTVVAQPAYDMGAAAVRLLLDRIDGNGSPKAQRIVLPVELVVRESSIRRAS